MIWHTPHTVSGFSTTVLSTNPRFVKLVGAYDTKFVSNMKMKCVVLFWGTKNININTQNSIV